MRNTWKAWTLAGSLMLALAGCGGGGGAPTAGGGGGSPVTPVGVTVSGVAATGAAFTGAVITVIDSRGITVGTSQPVGTTGAYSITLDAAAVVPFVLVATRTDANGDTQSLVSVIASTSATTANITPITTLIASRLSSSGDPTKLASELEAGTAVISVQAVAETVAEVQAILAPLLTATSTSSFDPLTGSFSTDGIGYDRLLDSVNITFLPSSATTTNIEIVVKQELAEGAQPEAVTFNSGDAVVPALNTIDPTTLVVEGTSARITDFLSRLTACYAVPTNQRATAPSTVSATECRDAFHQSNPGTFLSNGALVSSTGAFASLFNPNAVGVVFSQGTYEFTRTNGDLVIGYKSRAPNGAETYDTFVVRPDGPAGAGPLRLIGNQYQYGGRVTAYQQRRNFISLNQSAADYYSTGYVIDVPNTQSGGVALFDRVIVTTPSTIQVVLRPIGAVSFLGIARGDDPTTVGNEGTVTSTSFIRLRSEFVAGAGPGAHPSNVDTATLVFANPERSEQQLANTPSLGTWRYDYYLAGNATMTPDATQYFKNRARALTIGELRNRGLADLSPLLRSEISAGAETAGPQAGRIVWAANERADIGSAIEPGWSVTTGQLPPVQITLFGGGGGQRYTDSANVPSTARFGFVPCSPQNGGDTHCHNNGDGTSGPGYAAGSFLDGFHLLARDAGGREFANFYALYNLNLAP